MRRGPVRIRHRAKGATFPDYRNVLERMVAKRAAVTATGRSICSDPRLDGPALWTAEVRYDRISEWRVYDDTDSNRRLLGIS